MIKITDDSFRAVAELWMDKKYTTVKLHTAEMYRTNLEKHLLPAFGDLKIQEISSDSVSKFLADIVMGNESGKQAVSENTAYAILTQLHNILGFADEECGCSVQEISNVTLKKKTSVPRVLTREEEHRLRDRLTEDLTLRSLGILLCLDVGLRVGELCALKWGDLSEQEHTIHIHRSVIRVPVHNGTSKTELQLNAPKGEKSVRTVPVPENLRTLLEQHRVGDEVFLLTGNFECFADPRTMQYHLKKIMKACGIENAGFNTLRDTFAVRYLENGGDLLQLSRILGHINVSFTARHYQPACVPLLPERG